MATRDVTKEFLSYRNAIVRRRTPSSSSNNNNNDDSLNKKLTAGVNIGNNNNSHDLMLDEENGIQLSTFGNSNITSQSLDNNNNNNNNNTPSWVTDVNSIENIILEIQNLQTKLLHMHAQRIGSVFNKDLDNMEYHIEQLTITVTSKFRIAERLLQKVGTITKHYSNNNNGQQIATVGANIQRSLAKRLQEQSVTFRQSQRKYLAEVQAQKSGGLIPSSSTSSSVNNNNNNPFGIIDIDGSSGISNSNGTNDFFSNNNYGNNNRRQNQQQQQTSLVVVDDLYEAVHSRDTEIAKIAQSIEELGSIFKELAVLVIDQGTILDRIDYNMETVVESTKIGIKQLEKAEKSQKNARPLRCIICLSITIFILLFILILKHRPRHGWL